MKTIYVGGTNAVDASGQIIGKGDLAAQTEQLLKNIERSWRRPAPGPSTW